MDVCRRTHCKDVNCIDSLACNISHHIYIKGMPSIYTHIHKHTCIYIHTLTHMDLHILLTHIGYMWIYIYTDACLHRTDIMCIYTYTHTPKYLDIYKIADEQKRCLYSFDEHYESQDESMYVFCVCLLYFVKNSTLVKGSHETTCMFP